MSKTTTHAATDARRLAVIPSEEPPQIRRIAISDIRFDHAYQRDVRTEWVEHLVTNWDAKLAGVVILSSRAGSLYGVDGQHRVLAMAQRGSTHTDASILEGLSQMDEAHLFVLYNGASKHLTGWDKFKAQLVAQEPEAVEVEATVLSTGFLLGPDPRPNTIQALAGVRRIWRLGGIDLLALVLRTVRTMWHEDRRATTAPMLYGLGSFLHAYQSDDRFSFDRLSDIMEITPPTKFLRRATEIRIERFNSKASGFAVAESIREAYNANLGRDRQLGVLTTVAVRKAPPKRGSRGRYEG